jgi:uncharacterized lipoprotein
MKKLLMGLSLAALLAGCASRENNNGMGGTSDQSLKTDSINNTSSGNSSDQYNNNATYGTGATTGTNSATGEGMSQ